MTLFALMKAPAPRILRFSLTADLQREVQKTFADQLAFFENSIEEVFAFDGRYSPESDEALEIAGFQDVDGIITAIDRPLSIDQFDPARHSAESILALFMGHEHDIRVAALIQIFDRRRIISKKRLSMFYSGDTFQQIRDDGITLGDSLLAVLENGVLKFKSFHLLRRVFDLSRHYEEATNEDVEAFASHDALSVFDLDGFVTSAKPLVRRKISFIVKSGVLDAHSGKAIAEAALQFKLQIDLDPDERIILPTDRVGLRRILTFLAEDYYESPLSKTHFVSNSKRPAE
ncbi:Kiwa anti-phage protein KwaB-like domain-containing protein [Caballeronia sp. GAFFF2]|uniref:Kiwa anti-phage protein KwaB-like domain-containing protein n=1 Tax=Caballeronia sp. GAFFF2 TaxID=2921741 RepID=UPI002027A9E4|nr:Kiwa anti-phage protein KwaB-like domain-containing protein [Caballeronia sp. GAFFF2]